MKLPAGVHFGLLRRMDMTERVGILAAVSGVGQSFGRGLLPRSTADQAIITGVSLTINYAMTALAQSVTESLADAVTGRGQQSRRQRAAHRGVLLVGDLAALGTGLALQRATEQQPNEHIARAVARTLGWRLAVSGTAGSAIVVVDAALDAAGGNGKRSWLGQVPVSLPLGGALAAISYHEQRRAMVDQGIRRDAEGVSLDEGQAISVGRALALGTGVAGGLFVVAEGERLLADGVAAIVRRVSPSAEILAKPIGHLVGLALFAAAGNAGIGQVYSRAERGGAAVEAAYNQPPASSCVSGGPNSDVSWSDIGREGRRFVNMALTPTEITDVMGKTAMDPIRVFVGLDSADTTSGRADLAMRELERLGAFKRKLIVFCSPTGTGYLNYVTAESLEYLTGGNLATVAIQYSIRPSPQSLGRVKVAVEQNGAFLQALKWRLSAIPKSRRPRLVIFGESLGAQTSQDVFKDEGVAGLHRATVERGLFLGTPAATKWRQRWLANPDAYDPKGEVIEVDSYDEYLALSDEVRGRAHFVLLTHHNDPMPKFWFPIAVQSPRWLSRENREPGVPVEVHWRPYTTFLITLIDVKNAMHVIPGQFVAEGHDYRKDLARFTSVAFKLPVSEAKLEKMELALRQRELRWAERRLIDGQVAGAESKVHDQLLSWGIPEERIPTLIGSALPQGVDPYRAGGADG